MKFRDLFIHLGEMKHYLTASALVFLTGIMLGYGFVDDFRDFLVSQVQGMSVIAKSIQGSKHPQLFFFLVIFFNNTIKSMLVLFSGFFFGIFPLFFLVVNGMVLGYVFSAQTANTHIGLWELLLKGILPHGIIELPALVVASAFGIRFGAIMLKGVLSLFKLSSRASFVADLNRFKRMVAPLLVLLIISLFVAAVIESTITYWLIRT